MIDSLFTYGLSLPHLGPSVVQSVRKLRTGFAMRLPIVGFVLAVLCTLLAAPAAAQPAWEFIAPLDAPRTGAAAAVLDGRIYVVGGQNQLGTPLASGLRYDPTTGLWERLPPMQRPRAFAAAVVLQNRLFVLGGRTTEGEVLSDAEVFDPRTGTWQPFATMSESRQGLAAVVRNGHLFAAGGSNARDELLASVEVYDDRRGGWMTVEDTDEIDVEGLIQALTPTTITVSDTTFVHDDATRIRGENGEALALADLSVGFSVEVEGVRQADGAYYAEEIDVEDRNGIGEIVDLEGPIEALGDDALTVEGAQVLVDAQTEIVSDDGASLTFADLRVGQDVEVRAIRLPEGSLRALRIEAEQPDVAEVRVEGPIEALTASSLTVAATTYLVTASTEIENVDGQSIPFDSLRVGQTVEVRGERSGSGPLLAREIRLRDTDDDDGDGGDDDGDGDDGDDDGNATELAFCASSIDLNTGDAFSIRDYVQYEDGTPITDWSALYFTYTEAGADDPTSPPNWNLDAFNAGTPVTVTDADRASGTGNAGDGTYRLYVVRTGAAQFDDTIDLRIDDERDSEVDEARCAAGTATHPAAGSLAASDHPLASLGTPRASFAAVMRHDEVVYAGGFGRFGPLALVQVLYPDGRLGALPALPTARGGLGAAVLGDSVFVVGGQDVTNQVLADVLLLDGNAWRVQPRLNVARVGAAVVEAGEVLYVIGGEGPNGRVLDSVERWDVRGVMTASEEGAASSPFGLASSYPNPFRTATTLRFTTAGTASVQLDVFDLRGRLVARLLDTPLPAGSHTAAWDGHGLDGRPVGSGVYLGRLRQGARTAHLLLTVIR